MNEKGYKSMPVPIPKPWRDTVRGILHQRNKNAIFLTKRSEDDWQATFPNAFHYELYDALNEALGDDRIQGRYIADMVPRGETYEFFFPCKNRMMYGKLNLLLPARKIVFIISAHPPYKGHTL